MSFYKVKVVRLAETIRIGDNGEEERYIDVSEKKYERYSMTYHNGLLWIYDSKQKKMITTSDANLRMMIMFDAPKECLPTLRNQTDKTDKTNDK